MAKKILVVDDDMLVRELLKDFLSGIGYEVVEAENGLKALELITEGGFDMLITDLNMPVMDGYRLVNKVRDVLNLSMPILMISALSDKRQRELSRELIAWKKINFLMLKPLDLSDLGKLVEKFLN